MPTWTKSPKPAPEGTVYLLHFSAPVGTERQQAQHYIGWTGRTPEIRLKEHLDGNGCPLVRHAYAMGLEVRIVRTWQGTRALERRLKNQKNAPRLCPCCDR
jgi:hypothetical protein